MKWNSTGSRVWLRVIEIFPGHFGIKQGSRVGFNPTIVGTERPPMVLHFPATRSWLVAVHPVALNFPNVPLRLGGNHFRLSLYRIAADRRPVGWSTNRVVPDRPQSQE
jgi:hypothetical protein